MKDPALQIAVVKLADSRVNVVVRPWVNSSDYWGVYMAVHEAMKKAFDAEGIMDHAFAEQQIGQIDLAQFLPAAQF